MGRTTKTLTDEELAAKYRKMRLEVNAVYHQLVERGYSVSGSAGAINVSKWINEKVLVTKKVRKEI